MSKPWNELAPRERDALIAEKVMEWVQVHPDLWERPGEQWPAYTGERTIRTPCVSFRPTSDYNACRLADEEIARRGLIEKYQNALVNILDLDMQVFNSAIELNPHHAPEVPENTFEWMGHAYLWLYSHATADQKCHAALKALGVET